MSATPTAPVTPTQPDLIQVLTRIAEALELQNERVDSNTKALCAISFVLQDIMRCMP